MIKRHCSFFGFYVLIFASYIPVLGAQPFGQEQHIPVEDKDHDGIAVKTVRKNTINVQWRGGLERDLRLETLTNAQGQKEFLMHQNNDAQGDLIRLQNFRYRIDHAKNPSGEIIVLLHGSGGDETTLFSFARPIWPRATLVGIRGRLVQKGETRWFRKITPTKFDQKDVVGEAEAFVKFLESLGRDGGYDLSRVTFVGYSNGANFLAVIMMKHPELVKNAILLRSMPVLDAMPDENLSKTTVLTISGQKDILYSPFQPALSALLKKNGAKVESHTIEGDHMLGQADAKIIAKWVSQQNTSHLSSNTKTDKGHQ